VRRVAWAGVLLACLAPGTVEASSGPSEETLLRRLNDVRSAHGLRPLKLAPALEHSAGRFAGRLMATDVFGHGPRIRAGGSFRTLGETLALHTGWRPRPGTTVNRWLASPGHRPLVLSSRFRYAGAGVSHGRFGGRKATIWVLQLGAR
jgi:uncharacterized protein YkwD